MKFYDFYYREKGNVNAETLKVSFSAPSKQSATLMFKGTIDTNKYTIVKVETEK